MMNDGHLSGDPAYPGGPIWSVRRIRRDPIEFLASVSRLGDVAPFTIGGRRAFLLTHPRDIERVLVSDDTQFVKAPAFRRASRLLGNGLLTAEGSIHRHRRRIVQPAFRHDRLDGYAAPMVTHASKACMKWHDGKTVEVAREMQSLTATIAAETLFGVDLNETASIQDAVRAAAGCIDPLLTPVAPLRRLADARHTLRTLVETLIEDRVSARDQTGHMLSLLWRAETAPSGCSEQLRDDALTLFLAAHDTIGHALTWTWTLLAEHRAAEESLHRELDVVLGSRLPEASDVDRLTFTRAVFAEALRLFPPAWVIVRHVVNDHRTSGIDIRAGSLVFVSQFLTHRDGRFFAKPLKFIPERWLYGGTPPWPKFAYFPFGFGPRACIGEGFAWVEGILVLATIAQKWELRAVAGHRVDPDPRITLRPRSALMRLERRRNQAR